MTQMQIYQIRFGAELISTRGSLNDYLLRAVNLGGPPPDAWHDIWNIESRHCNGMLYFRSLCCHKILETYGEILSIVGSGGSHNRDEAWENARRVAFGLDSLLIPKGRIFLTWLRKWL
jgi:hypothetical protein